MFIDAAVGDGASARRGNLREARTFPRGRRRVERRHRPPRAALGRVGRLPDAGGGSLLYISEGEGYAAIRQMQADGSDDELIYDGSGYESTVTAHPDGGLLIFTSADTGRDELYVYASGGRYIQQLTSNGAAAARWVREDS